MCPSPRYSRRIDWACHSTRCGASGHVTSQWAAASGRPSSRRSHLLGRRPGQLGRPRHVGRAQRPLRPGRGATRRRPPRSAPPPAAAGAATFQLSGMADWTSSGLKLKKVDTTTSAGTAPIGAAREAKYPARPVMPSRGVGLGRLGHEVDRPVQRLEGAPGLAGQQRGCSVVAHNVFSSSRRSTSAAVAATTGRRGVASRRTRSLPSRSPSAAPASRQISSPAR